MRKKYVYDKKNGGVVEAPPEVGQSSKSPKFFGGFGKTTRRKKKEIRALMDAKAVTIVDDKSGALVNVATTRRKERAKWPIISDAMAVNPEHIGKAKAALKEHGVKTDYTPTGEPILRSAAHRKAHAIAMGFYDRNGGYGDPEPRNR
jgi:hypothetical protein